MKKRDEPTRMGYLPFEGGRSEASARETEAAILIDQIGGKRGCGIQPGIRQRAHDVRRVRNDWAHESNEALGPMTIEEARHRLQTYLRELPDEWACHATVPPVLSVLNAWPL